MLAARRILEKATLFLLITLQAFDVGKGVDAAQTRVFARRLVPPPPARVAVNVDVRTPVRQTRVSDVVEGSVLQ